MTRRAASDDDALEDELSKRPEDPRKDTDRHERAERNDRGEDAASAEFDFRPEPDSSPDTPNNASSVAAAARNQENDESDVAASSSHDKDEKVRPSGMESLLDVAAHWSWITIFSILGTLTRLGLQSLNDYSGHLIPPLVWAQFVGCAVMGFVTEDDRLFPKKKPKNDALFLGITVGYCGSTTSFSAWILQVYEDLANTEGYRRPRGYNVISILTQVMVTLAASVAAFRLGNHLALFADKTLPLLRPIPRLSNRALIVLLIAVAIGFQAATIVISGVRRDWRGIVGFAMVFTPAGALTRWYLSRNMNRLAPTFPLGTFTANVAGSALESIFYLLQYRVVRAGNACALLQGLQDGYCGALTTVSTFIVELCSLQRAHAYRYALASLFIASVLYVLVDGIDYWTHGSTAGAGPRCVF